MHRYAQGTHIWPFTGKHTQFTHRYYRSCHIIHGMAMEVPAVACELQTLHVCILVIRLETLTLNGNSSEQIKNIHTHRKCQNIFSFPENRQYYSNICTTLLFLEHCRNILKHAFCYKQQTWCLYDIRLVIQMCYKARLCSYIRLFSK